MNVLIIGGTGVLSSAVASAFVKRGESVYILTDGNGRVPEPPGIRVHLKADRTNPTDLRRALRSVPVRHWGVVVDVICYTGHEASALAAILDGSFDHLIVVSTSFVYDRRNRAPIHPGQAIAPAAEMGRYGLGKVEMEQFWLQYAREKKRPVTVFRPSQIIGAGCHLGLTPLHNRDPLLLTRIRNGEPIVLADGGRQQIQTVYSDDAAHAIALAAGNDRCFCKTYNCVNPVIHSASDHIQIVGQLLGATPLIIGVPSESVWASDWGWVTTTVSRIVSMDELWEDLGYIPKTPMEQSVEAAVAFQMAHRDGNSGQGVRPGTVADVASACTKAHGQVLESINRAALERPKDEVDLRMNDKGPCYT